MTSNTAYRISASVAFLGVALGAFGAHALQSTLEAHNTAKIWTTATMYHLVHAVALLVVSREYDLRKAAWWCFLLGTVVFAGTLYVLAVTNLRWLGAITPLGGLSFLAGWAWLALGRGTKAN